MALTQTPGRAGPPEGALRPQTLAELLERLGHVPAHRIRLDPAPGTATEDDLLRPGEELPVCELVDGVLVEKAMGYYESVLAAVLIGFLRDFLKLHDLGIVAGPDGKTRLLPGLIRAPDVSFVSWSRMPGRRLPRRPIPDLAPDLAVEVLSESNTPQEMGRKLKEYFRAGTRMVWLADPETRIVRVYTTPEQAVTATENETLDGGGVLPGFKLRVRDWFSAAGDRGA
jgi:Uma2 family endonuclease